MPKSEEFRRERTNMQIVQEALETREGFIELINHTLELIEVAYRANPFDINSVQSEGQIIKIVTKGGVTSYKRVSSHGEIVDIGKKIEYGTKSITYSPSSNFGYSATLEYFHESQTIVTRTNSPHHQIPDISAGIRTNSFNRDGITGNFKSVFEGSDESERMTPAKKEKIVESFGSLLDDLEE